MKVKDIISGLKDDIETVKQYRKDPEQQKQLKKEIKHVKEHGSLKEKIMAKGIEYTLLKNKKKQKKQKKKQKKKIYKPKRNYNKTWRY